MPKVTTIPATLTRIGGTPISENRRRKVAGYARVSTDSDEQSNSYEAQVDYYTNYIQQHDGWEFVKVYTDEGISATNTIHRLGFQEMIRDAMNGRIDLIVTKSVSRFARNTVDSLTTVRMLKEKGIEIYFEKENIWTLDSKGELLITIMSSLAQEESRSISENTKWGKRKLFSDGVVYINTSTTLGYRKVGKGQYEIVEEEAEVIRYIYSSFLAGVSLNWIARTLQEKGIPSPMGKRTWSYTSVKGILTNEKYTGNALLQKTIGVDFLTKKRKQNEGEVPQYYVEDSHPAIIEKRIFDAVQEKLKNGHVSRRRGSLFSGMIFCADCGSPFISKTWHSNSKYRKVVWQCEWKYNNSRKCTTPHLSEEEIKTVVVKAINSILRNRKEMISVLGDTLENVFSIEALEKEITGLENELMLTKGMLEEAFQKMSTLGSRQKEASSIYDDLASRYSRLQADYEVMQEKLGKRKEQRVTIETFIDALKSQKELLTEFSPELFSALVEKMVVQSREKISIYFKDGNTFIASMD